MGSCCAAAANMVVSQTSRHVPKCSSKNGVNCCCFSNSSRHAVNGNSGTGVDDEVTSERAYPLTKAPHSSPLCSVPHIKAAMFAWLDTEVNSNLAMIDFAATIK